MARSKPKVWQDVKESIHIKTKYMKSKENLMFNLRKTKEAQVATEKYLRQNTLGPIADDGQPIAEKVLPHREGDKDLIAEADLDNEENTKKEMQIIEKILDGAKSFGVEQRVGNESGIMSPPINEIVARMEKERVAADFKTQKEPHWSQTSAKRQQNQQRGALPKWPKNAPQHDKTVLNNDRDRFKGKADAGSGDVMDTEMLVGGLRVADLAKAVKRIKQGKAADYDMAITAILREADLDERELTQVEQTTVSDLKTARTRAMLKK